MSETTTLSITKENAVKAYESGSRKIRKALEDLFGVKTFQKSVMERVKTWADVLAENSITAEEFEKSTQGMLPDEVAYRKVKMICKALNEGWVPDWDNASETKYYPWFTMDSGRGFSFYDYGSAYLRTSVGSRLCLKSWELAKYAATQFTREYEQFFK